MTRHTPLWLQAGSYPASEDRWLLGAFWPGPGCIGGSVAFASGMSVNVSPCTVAVPTQNNTGTTLCHSDAYEQVTLAAAPASGTNRYDLVTCQPRGNDLDGGANNDLTFTTVTGVAAASPAVPATPAGAVALAQIYVPGGSAAITPANIVDVRPAMLNPAAEPAGSSGPLVARQDMNGDWWVCKQGVNGGLWRRARDVLHCRYWRATAWTTPTGSPATVIYDHMANDPYGLYTGGQGVVPIAGLWRCRALYSANSTATAQFLITNIATPDGAQTGQGIAITSGVQGMTPAAEVQRICAAGDVFTPQCQGSAALAGNVAPYVAFTLDYLGTG
jgi:hypothetical protein